MKSLSATSQCTVGLGATADKFRWPDSAADLTLGERRGEARQPSATDGHTGPTRQMLPRCALFHLPHLQAWPCAALTNMRSAIGRINVPLSHPCDPQRPGSIRKSTTAPRRRRAVDSEGLLLMRITPHPDGRVTRER